MFKNRAKRGILMFINVQLTAINVKKPREAQTSVVHHDAALHLAVCRLTL